MTALFVSDLHLTHERQEIQQIFFRFLRGEARSAQVLYILGDLFDYWIGDDDIGEPFHHSVATELAALANSGCTVYFMRGNRDFLIGESFAAAAGVHLLADPTLIDLQGHTTLLMHGDTLCTADADYQRFRAQVRAPDWQRSMLAKPLNDRRATALEFMRASATNKQGKTDEIMDVAADAVEQAFRQYACTRLIHGHTHRPALHQYRFGGVPRERWVLADWYERGEALRVSQTGVLRLPLT